MKYMYPDIADKCDRKKYECYGAEKWWFEERWILDCTLDFLDQKYGRKADLMLDIGCGTGRLMAVFAPMFKRIIGIEPDASRLAEAEGCVADLDNPDITLLHGQVPYFDLEHAADFILCSHVLQHISTEMLSPFLTWISDHLRPKGSALLLFEKSTSPISTFTLESEHGDRKNLEEIEFNQLLQETGYLPTHKIPPAKLVEIIEAGEMRIHRQYSYHLNRAIPHSFLGFCLVLLNHSIRLSRKIGDDHAMLVVKEPTGNEISC